MGKWAEGLFGRDSFGEVGIVISGSSTQEFEKKVLNLFDRVQFSKDSVYHAHLTEKDGNFYPIVFNVYGAPAMVDVLTKMHDGGCNNVVFIGHAYGGFKNLDIGRIILPLKSYHFDGIYHLIEPDREFSIPDDILKNKIKQLFNKNGVSYTEGVNISVPAVTLQIPHENQYYKEIKPDTVEMELAACFSRSKDIGVRAIGVLIISDNRDFSISSKEKYQLREPSKMKVIELVIDNIESFNLKSLSTGNKFSVNEYLAKIIENPNDSSNVYKKK